MESGNTDYLATPQHNRNLYLTHQAAAYTFTSSHRLAEGIEV